MKAISLRPLALALGALSIAAAISGLAIAEPALSDWRTVVNNGDLMPTASCDPANPPTPPGPTCRHFNSYNQPSVNVGGVVVIRARSKGGGGSHGEGGEKGAVSTAAEGGVSGDSGHGNQPVHGIYTRDMASPDSPIVKILDRKTEVPQPNNIRKPPGNPLLTTFIETPSMPRIDMWSETVATRGNHEPVWKVVDTVTGDILEQLGTTGIYTNPFGVLITGASKLGKVPDFWFFEVPEAPGTPFDVFPGAPAVTDTATIVFKGNYTLDGFGKTGVYYRDLTDAAIPLGDGTELTPAGGMNPVVLIANNTDTLIPGTATVFGSTAPPSAATTLGKKGKRNRMTVFAGFDNEANPTKGGIYLAPLTGTAPPLRTLVYIGGQVPGENKGVVFNRLGEGVSFDGRFVAFWGAWGNERKALILKCREDGNPARFEYCMANANNFLVRVPVNQGFFVHDTKTSKTHVVAKAPGQYSDFVYWNFSGLVPGTGESDEDGEPARWRSSSFVAVSGLVNGTLKDATFHTAFKARTGSVENGAYVNPVDGIYLRKSPGASPILTMVETGMDGTLIDPEAVYVEETGATVNLPVTEMGIERDGFRGNMLAINVSMGTEEAGWAGVYLTEVIE